MSNPEGWHEVESFIQNAYKGRTRKNGEPMANHSLRIGRALATAGYDAITVFGGYGHDLLEDTSITEEELLIFANVIFRDAGEAEAAVLLVKECSYSKDEYLLSKPDRKAAACARWIASADQRVHAVKSADVDDNEVTAPSVSEIFYREYMSWAGPLRRTLRESLSARALQA